MLLEPFWYMISPGISQLIKEINFLTLAGMALGGKGKRKCSYASAVSWQQDWSLVRKTGKSWRREGLCKKGRTWFHINQCKGLQKSWSCLQYSCLEGAEFDWKRRDFWANSRNKNIRWLEDWSVGLWWPKRKISAVLLSDWNKQV